MDSISKSDLNKGFLTQTPWRIWVLMFGFWTLISLMGTIQDFWISFLYPEKYQGLGMIVLRLFPYFYGWFAVTPLIFWFGKKFGFDLPGKNIKNIFIHLFLCFFTVFIYLFITSFFSVSIVEGIWEMGTIFDNMGARTYIAGHYWVVTYWAILGVYVSVDYNQRFREREALAARLHLQKSELESQLNAAKLAQTEMHLQVLRQKISPHFLFNNLNVLSSLIEKNPKAANVYLDKLAQIYRYILHHQEAEIVPLKDEFEFVRDYIFLLKERFGRAYNFTWDISDFNGPKKMIIPTALQSLIENVIKHNAGNKKKPLRVLIKTEEDFLFVENDLSPKSAKKQKSGTGLDNLVKTYGLLTDKKVEIISNEKIFSVKIPILELKK